MNPDETYYKETQASLRSYDIKLWAIPVVFLTVTGFIINELEIPDQQGDFDNEFLLLAGVVLYAFIIAWFTKAHFYHVSLQAKVNEYDDIFNKENPSAVQRIPHESQTRAQLLRRIADLLDDKDNSYKFSGLQVSLLNVPVTTYFKGILYFTFLFDLGFLLYLIIR